ncbi:MAG: ribosome small subunit-dependent GTPase A [Opitutales bacterium]
MELAALGWTPERAVQAQSGLRQGLQPARVTRQNRHDCTLAGEAGTLTATVAGQLHRRGTSPVIVGDWVLYRPMPEGLPVVETILERSSLFLRQSAGKRATAQPVAANVDRAFILTTPDRDFRLNRLERFLVLAEASGTEAALLLNKTDLADDPEALLTQMGSVAMGRPVLGLRAETGEGVEAVRALIGTGQTAAFLGSSGMGKSTLINQLLGVETLQTGAIREADHRGRHTTTWRELLPLPGGGVVIDTPGLREIQLVGNVEAFERVFADVVETCGRCRFSNCTHQNEPGCAVREALASGALSTRRLAHYFELRAEVEAAAARFERRAKQKARSNVRARKETLSLQADEDV